MPRLPQVGQDNNEWGTILNEYLEVSHTSTGRTKSLVTTAEYSATITPDIDTTDILNIGTLTGNITIANPTGTPVDGQILTLRLTQDSTGGRILTFGTSYTYNSSQIPTTSSSTWEMSFRYNSTSTKWEEIIPIGDAVETVSRTIYISTTGNDTTGDGTSSLPYLAPTKALSTIKRIIGSGVTITLYFVAGTYDLSANDLNTISQFNGAGTLTIEGELALVDSGFTMGSSDPNDPMTFTVSGGNTATWTTNQWKFYFLKSGANYIPITHNTNTTISVAGADTGTEIYELKSIVNFVFPSTEYVFKYNVNFILITIVATFNQNFHFYNSLNRISFQNVKGIGLTTARIFNAQPSSNWTMLRCCWDNVRFQIQNPPNAFIRNYFYINTNGFVIAAIGYSVSLATYFNIVIENPNTGVNATCLNGSYGQFDEVSVNLTRYLKFVNSDKAISIANRVKFQFTGTPKIILRNVNYLLTVGDDYGDIVGIMNIINILGVPNTRWCYKTMYEFVNLTTGRNIQITGLIYPEHESNLSSTLTDNTTTNVVVGNKLQNRSIIIDYTITRGTTFEAGRLRVVHNGTTLSLTEDTPTGDDVGVSFAVAFNTNEIQLQCTLTSTGTSATMKYNATRVMITPLAI